MPLDAIARKFARRTWQDDLADIYRAIFRRGEYVAGQADEQARAVLDATSREMDRFSRQAGRAWALADRNRRHYARDAARRYDMLEAGLTRQVRSRPLKALAVAAAAGVILGLLTSRS